LKLQIPTGSKGENLKQGSTSLMKPGLSH